MIALQVAVQFLLDSLACTAWLLVVNRFLISNGQPPERTLSPDVSHHSAKADIWRALGELTGYGRQIIIHHAAGNIPLQSQIEQVSIIIKQAMTLNQESAADVQKTHSTATKLVRSHAANARPVRWHHFLMGQCMSLLSLPSHPAVPAQEWPSSSINIPQPWVRYWSGLVGQVEQN